MSACVTKDKTLAGHTRTYCQCDEHDGSTLHMDHKGTTAASSTDPALTKL
jgi:hypothetical protein